MKSLIGGTLDWIDNPATDNSTIVQWGAGLLIILLLAFLWSTVVKSMMGE